MITIEHSHNPDSEWNKRLIDSNLGTIYQTVERANFLKTIDVQPYFLKFIDENKKIVGQLLMGEFPRFIQENPKRKLLRKIPGIKKKEFRWVSGPVFLQPKRSSEIYVALNNFLKTKKAVVSGWTHPLSSGDPKDLEKFFQIIKWGTHLIDLSQSKDEIYNNIDKSSGRKNIERSLKRGVSVEEITEDSLVEFYDLINTMRKDAKQEESNLENLIRRWKLYQTVGFSGFLARKNQQPVGGLLFSYVCGHIMEAGVARSKTDTEEKLYSQDLIKWKIIEWGIENNMNYFNLNGFNPDPSSKKEENIRRYKEKWGGKPYFYYRILQKPNILTNKI